MAGNSLFDKYFRRSGNGENNANQQTPQQPQNIVQNVINGFNQISNNQGNIADMLLQNGRINQQQYNEIKSMGNNYARIGQYLMQYGAIPQNVGQMNPFVSQLLNFLHR